jgi:tetratricopeptide (TPR) repeat protein
LNKAAEQNSENADVFFNLARVKFQVGQLQEALDDINKALAISETTHYYLTRSQIQNALGNFGASLKDAESSLFFNDNYNESWTYFIISQTERSMGNLKGALENINTALQNGEKTALKADMALYYWFSAVIKYDLNNKSEALDDINKALTILETLNQSDKNKKDVPSDQIAKFYSLRADIKKDLNDIQGSVKDIDSAIALLNDFLSKNDKSQYEGLQGQVRDLENQKQSYK